MSARCPTCGIDRDCLAELLERAAMELRGEVALWPSSQSELASRIGALIQRARELRIDLPPEGLSEQAAADLEGVHLTTIRRWRKQQRGADWKLRRPPFRWTLEELARAHFC